MTTTKHSKKKLTDPNAPMKIDVQKEIYVEMILEGPNAGWVHTHGMVKFGKPELEIRNVPIFMVFYAGMILNNVADSMLNGDENFQPNETMRIGRELPFRFKALDPLPGEHDHYVDVRWALVDLEDEELKKFCQGCQCGGVH